MNIVFLVSGNGGHLHYLFKSIKYLGLPICIAGVVADRECGAVAVAKAHNIPCNVISYQKRLPQQLRFSLQQYQPDIIVTNIHKIIDAETLSLYPGKFINLHYSLLPAFAGLIGMQTIKEAMRLETRFIGATCHTVIAAVDAGPILSQGCFAVNWSTPIADLEEVMFRLACLNLIDGILTYSKTAVADKIPEVLILNNRILFNPPLRFNAPKLLSSLWPNNR